MTEIVKVQRPALGTSDDGEWLIYDEAQKHIEQVPGRIIPTYVKEAMGEDYAAYFSGAWSSIVGWGLSRRVKGPTW